MTAALVWSGVWWGSALVGSAVGSWTDWHHRVIPNRLIVVWAVGITIATITQALVYPAIWHWIPHAAGFGIMAGVLGLAFALRYVGGGDVKLGCLWGWCLGWPAVVGALWATTVISLGMFAWAMWRARAVSKGKEWRKTSIPWAVAVCLGTVADGILRIH